MHVLWHFNPERKKIYKTYARHYSFKGYFKMYESKLVHETYTTLSVQILHQQSIVRFTWRYFLSFKKIRIYYLKDNCPAPKHGANTLDGVPSWTAVSGDQFITVSRQGKEGVISNAMP